MKRIHRYWFVLLVCSISILSESWLFREKSGLSDAYIGRDVSQILAVMSKKDRENLEYFFRELIHKDQFGYAMLGEKPMALGGFQLRVNPFKCLWESNSPSVNASYFTPSRFEKFCWYTREAISTKRFKFKRGYETWKKYEKFFPMTRFTIVDEESNRNGCTDLLVVLINNESFVKKVNGHLEDFEKALNQATCGQKLLEEGKSKPLFSQVLNDHEGLIGILLGFGREHAFWFHQKYKLDSLNDKAEFCTKFNVKLADVDELGYAWTEKEMLGSDPFWLPGFRADPSCEETQSLRAEYLKTYNKLVDFYRGKDFLETTLNILTSN